MFKEETPMLVLTRQESERIMIGDDVELVVLGVQGQRVKLGIRAARDQRIRRGEIADEIHAQPAGFLAVCPILQ
jgi:carbon storage regulator